MALRQHTITFGRRDEEFILSEATGFRSRDDRTVKGGEGVVYESGSVLIAEHEEVVVGEDSSYEPTGLHILATAAAIAAYGVTPEALDVAIVTRRTNAESGNVTAPVLDQDAEVKDTELVFGDSTGVADLYAALRAAGIKVRKAI